MTDMNRGTRSVIVRKPFAGHRPGEWIEVPEVQVEALIRVGRVSIAPPKVETRGPVWTARRVEAGPSVVREVVPESLPQPARVTVDALGRGWFVVSVDGVQETREDGTIVRRREADANEPASEIIRNLIP